LKTKLRSIILYFIPILFFIILTASQAAADIYLPPPTFEITGINHELLLAGVLTLMLVICAAAEIISIIKQSRKKAGDASSDSDSRTRTANDSLSDGSNDSSNK